MKSFQVLKTYFAFFIVLFLGAYLLIMYTCDKLWFQENDEKNYEGQESDEHFIVKLLSESALPTTSSLK